MASEGYFFSATAGAVGTGTAPVSWTTQLPLLSAPNRLGQIWLTSSGSLCENPWQPKQFGAQEESPCWKVSMLMLVSSSEPRCRLVASPGTILSPVFSCTVYATGGLPESAPPLVQIAPISV